MFIELHLVDDTTFAASAVEEETGKSHHIDKKMVKLLETLRRLRAKRLGTWVSALRNIGVGLIYATLTLRKLSPSKRKVDKISLKPKQSNEPDTLEKLRNVSLKATFTITICFKNMRRLENAEHLLYWAKRAGNPKTSTANIAKKKVRVWLSTKATICS